MRMLLGLTEALPSLVEAKFNAAKASSSLLFSPSELAIIRTSAGVPVSVPVVHLAYEADIHVVPIALLPITCEETHSTATRNDTEAEDRPL
jgi:ATP adenylyltransferase